MRIPRIFTHQALVSNSTLSLAEPQSHYLSKVLRMQAGRELILFNGEGGEYAAEISAVHKKHVDVHIKEFSAENRQSHLQLELAIGVSRGERMDWVLQKATELGATKIIPLITERTEVKLTGERADKKMEHWQQIIISACEQCQRNLLPELSEPANYSDWVTQCNSELKFVLHHRDSKGLPKEKTTQSVALLIGPEGGLDEHEIAQAVASGFSPLTLGPRVLRTETAPVAAISLVQYLWGDF
ncbi:ribosomal RNA small subunit methyltransferase E [Cellvibrio zantedeschiae]|uniref:Ribosomal RNA small subunit methyltransferase E n=1 Tax=Cellvibrio zantedeschiae TaxID=1237077 RepID=A0ABQ3B7R6_9GAMM|nr:16S rRNA (uracil(1498)-N(3))-methyltransferase [Cellvibrio zantedeschiae]GGY82578.1 ribosomal RNA small subunit methyltransferase E [Cellvibrio zantedeschiae]